MTRLVAVLAIVAVTVTLYVTQGDPFAFITPPVAHAVRLANIVTGLAAMVGLVAMTSSRWSTYDPAWRDAIRTLLIYEFVVVVFAGQAIVLAQADGVDLAYNQLGLAMLLGNIGALKLLWHIRHSRLHPHQHHSV